MRSAGTSSGAQLSHPQSSTLSLDLCSTSTTQGYGSYLELEKNRSIILEPFAKGNVLNPSQQKINVYSILKPVAWISQTDTKLKKPLKHVSSLVVV